MESFAVAGCALVDFKGYQLERAKMSRTGDREGNRHCVATLPCRLPAGSWPASSPRGGALFYRFTTSGWGVIGKAEGQAMKTKISENNSKASPSEKAAEWVGGLLTFAHPRSTKPEFFGLKVKMLVFQDETRTTLGFTVESPDRVLSLAVETLKAAFEHPPVGEPKQPTRLRVSSRELANVIQAGYPDLEVVCAPTPEIEALKLSIREDPIGELVALEPFDWEYQLDLRFYIEAELLRELEKSPEGRDLKDVEAYHVLSGLITEHCSRSIASVSAKDLDLLVFDHLPEEMCDFESSAENIIASTRALFAYLHRRYKLENALSCMELLDEQRIADHVEILDQAYVGTIVDFETIQREDAADAGALWNFVNSAEKRSPTSQPQSTRKTTSKKASRLKANKRKSARRARRKNR